MTQEDGVNSPVLHGAPSAYNTAWEPASAAASDCLHMSTAQRRPAKGRGVQGQSKGEIQRTLLMPCNTSHSQ